MRDYVVMDLENPNFRQNSICAIGVMLIRNNNVVERKYSLINPEDTFDNINIQITIIIVQLIIAVKMLKINIELTYSI